MRTVRMTSVLMFLLMVSLNSGFAQSFTIDDAEDKLLGEVLPHRASDRLSIRFSPDGQKAAVLYRDSKDFSVSFGDRKRINNVIRFIGWKMPERQSAVLVKSGAERKLLLDGKDAFPDERIHDAFLLNEGRTLVLVRIQSDGMHCKWEGASLGPHESISYLESNKGKPVLFLKDGDTQKVFANGHVYPEPGRPLRFLFSEDGRRVLWESYQKDYKRQAVVDGQRSVLADRIRGGLHYSPNRKHVTYVLRQGKKYTAWLNGKEIKAEKDIVSLRAFDDGAAFYVESWREPAKEKKKPDLYRSRLTIKGKTHPRIFERPFYHFEELADWGWYGVSRNAETSVIAWLARSGDLRLQEVKGNLGLNLAISPDRQQTFLTIVTQEGILVEMDGKRLGPYDKVSRPHFMRFAGHFAFVAQRDEKVYLIVGERVYPLRLNQFYEPICFSETELTAVVVGTLEVRLKNEIWSKVVLLD